MSTKRDERREYWRKIVAEQERSGQPVRIFCRQRQVGEHSFYMWRRRLAQEMPAERLRFALVETAGAALGRSSEWSGVEVMLPSGERLRVAPGTDGATVRLVLDALRAQTR